MKPENTQVQMWKGIPEYFIFLIVLRGEVFAPDMPEEITPARIMVAEGGVYWHSKIYTPS